MAYYADIYVIKKNRSKKDGLKFLNYFLPNRKESSDEYLIPQFSKKTIQTFHRAEDLMDFLELHKNYAQAIYWSNSDNKNPNAHGMLFYTEDGCMIFGISRDMNEIKSNRKPEKCLEEMQEFLETNIGYITYETPPEDTYEEFLSKIKK